VAIERKALPLLILAVVLFVVTGSYMLVTNPAYQGLGTFSTTWAVGMLLKHLLVSFLVVTGALIDYLIRGLPEIVRDEDRAKDLRWIGLLADGATGLGGLIALATAIAQLAA
jgi:hypothetical protein